MAVPTINVRVPHSGGDGSLIDPEGFAYDMVAKMWKHKLTIAKEVIEKHTRSVVTKDNLVALGVPVLQDRGFVTHDIEREKFLRRGEIGGDAAKAESMDEAQADEPATMPLESPVEGKGGDDAPKSGKRGRQSKYPYKTMAIGESFLIDGDSVGVTLNHSLLGDRGFEIKVVSGRFQVTRTK